MMMPKSKVIEILGISTLDNELVDNVLELCGIVPVPGFNTQYDVEEVCRYYAKAAVFFKEYLPEYYVSELLGISVDELINMNIEYINTPVEMQCMFYDSYPSGKFKYSTYFYNAIQVYKMLNVLSKSVYLEISDIFAQQFKSCFVSLEAAATTLGFTKISPSLYHYYLMLLDVRYARFNNNRFYLTDDLINVSEKAAKIFIEYIAFNEAREKYGYHILSYLCNEYSFHPYKDIVMYDVIFSDTRYNYEYRDSYTFISRKEIQKAYLNWFRDSICKNNKEVISIKIEDYKFECDYQNLNFRQDYIVDDNFSMSVFDQKIYWHTEVRRYERDPEFEKKLLLCMIYGIDSSKINAKFDKMLKAQNISKLIWPDELCNISSFIQELERAIYYNSLNKNKIKNTDSIENDTKSDHKDTLNFFIQDNISLPKINKINVYQNNRRYVHKDILKFWNNIDRFRYDLCENDYLNYENSLYVSYNSHKLNCLKQYYSSKIFSLYSDERLCVLGRNVNLSNQLYSLKTNEHLQNLLYDDCSIAMFLKELYPLKFSAVFIQQKNNSTLTMSEVLDKTVEFWPFDKVISYLNINKYNFTLIWAILYSLELSIYYYREYFYFKVVEIKALRKYVTDLLKEYIPVKNLYQILHKTHPVIKITNEIVAPSAMFYFLMPENYRGFYFIKKISLELLDEVYNESVNYNTFLTNAEIKSDLTILPTKILSSFASILLNIESYWFNELDQNHSLYADNSNLFCKRDTVIKLIEQQKYHKDTFILEDKIREFLKLEIDRFTETDKDVLKTINVYNAPDYIMHMSGNKGIVNNRAYRKEDVISIKEFLHVSRNTQYDVKVDNDISSKYPYQTYLIPLEPLGLIRTLEQISKPSADIWDKFVKLQLKFQQCSEKTINIKINQYIKTLNIIINLLQANEVSEFSCLQTGILNRWLKNINSVTYSSILIGFFKFAAIEYISQGKKIKYRYKELKPYNNTKSKPDDLLPEIYSFTEYSKLFNYCNDYYTHIEIAVNEILDYGTCTYASTWFYVMSHLNNAWRSNDFSMFPYIDILDVINRSTNDDVKWFLNNRMTKSDATIIALRIQNNPKVISKTKKYTRFVCSDELLETYTTAYSLLAFYTTEYLSIEIGFIITYL